MKKISLTIIMTTFFLPLFGIAQVLPTITGSVDIILSPEHPKPGQDISLEIVSSSFNLKTSTIVWSKDGAVEESGVGITTYRAKAPSSGKSTRVVVNVDDGNISASDSITISPGTVALIWEADSYTPRFYRGKGLASHQSGVRVVAIPNLVSSGGAKFGSNDLFYKWSLDNELQNNQSGFGKNVFSFSGLLVSRPRVVNLVVETQDGSVSARERIVVNFIDPEILFYRKNPLTGVRSGASLRSGVVGDGESAFVFEPYFFSRESVDNSLLEYKWTLDGKKLDELSQKREIVFSDDISGVSRVSVQVFNPFSLLQVAKNVLKVIINE